MRFLKFLLLSLWLVPAVSFAEPVVRVAAGLNGIWYNGGLSLPSDIEGGGNARASLSPHLSLVGEGYFGFQNSYARGAVGPRITATDVENRDFSVGFGASYNFSSEPAIRPQEWTGDVAVGLRPWPQTQPRVIVGAKACYGFESEQAYLTVGLRYALGYMPTPEVQP